ncbi:integrator complex subunit 7 [Paragonimus westermani]|uniref:Integrator complex subunit 7 n=1 Tax=Paragonimus westermani TaxID=34504 RepID=A0A5J4N7Q8_9TREM|nr:integrator complex subunit 7 [Paragonimus westermani]
MSPQSDEQIYHPASLLSRVSAQVTHLLTSSTTSTSVHVSILPVCGLIFQLSEGTLLTAAEQQTLLTALARAVIDSEGLQENVCAAQLSPIPPRLPCWLAYQVARQANRYGQHDLAASIYEKLSPLTLSERTNYWLRGLWEFSRAEAQLLLLARRLHADCPEPRNDIPGAQEVTRSKPQPWVDDLIDGLRQASDIVHKTRSMFICVGGSDNRWFQAEYVGIRGSLYLCLAELCISANYFTHVSRWPGRYRSRCTDSVTPTAVRALAVPTWVVRQLDLWCGLADRLCTLQSQCLDADQTTHGHLYAYPFIIQLVGFFIDVLQSIRDVYGGADKLHYEQVPVSENLSKGDPFRTVLQELRQIAQSHMKFNPLHTTNFDWLSYLALQVARVASHWPRFFFQRLQTSTVRLVLLPKAGNNPEDVLTVSSEVGHMVQVMGVVQQRSRLPHGQVARRIHAVEVELTVTTAFSETPGLHRRGVGDLVFSSIRSARLQRDYFHCEFCVRFPDPVQLSLNTAQRQANTIYRVSAVAILSDTFGTRWRLTHASGAPIETTLVRVESTNSSSLSVPPTPTKPTDPADSRVHV